MLFQHSTDMTKLKSCLGVKGFVGELRPLMAVVRHRRFGQCPFNAILACNGCSEPSKHTLKQAVGIAYGCLYRTNHLVLCSGLIFGLIDGWPCHLLLRVS